MALISFSYQLTLYAKFSKIKWIMGEIVKNKERQNTDKIKPFLFGDAIIYLIIAVCIIALLLSFFFLSKNKELSGFTFSLNGKTILTYDIKEDRFDIAEGFNDSIVIEKKDGGYQITIYSKEKTQSNTAFIDKTSKSVRVTKSTCKKDYCVHSPAITSDGVIYCDPHGLKIAPIGAGGHSGPIVVG